MHNYGRTTTAIPTKDGGEVYPGLRKSQLNGDPSPTVGGAIGTNSKVNAQLSLTHHTDSHEI